MRGGLRLCQQQGLVTTWPSREKLRWMLRRGYRKSGSGEGGWHHLGCGQFEAPVPRPGETRGTRGAARVLELRAGGLGRADRALQCTKCTHRALARCPFSAGRLWTTAW